MLCDDVNVTIPAAEKKTTTHNSVNEIFDEEDEKDQT